MKIGIISDTHDDLTNTNKAIKIFDENNVQVIIHAGDIISPPIITEFKKLTDKGIKFFGILGNNDGEINGLKNAFRFIGGVFLDKIGKIEIDNLKFAIYHGQDLKKKDKLIKSEKFDVIILGHSHTRVPTEDNFEVSSKTLVLNPGNAHREEQIQYLQKPYFQKPSVIIFETTTRKFEFIYL